MENDVLNLLTAIGVAKAKGEPVAEVVERYAADNNLNLEAMGRRARRSVVNRVEAAAMTVPQAIARASAVLGETPKQNEDFNDLVRF
jgi:hypothetical protein